MTSVMHHPDDNLLVEFSAGTLDWALGIAVSGHLHYCQRCRFRVNELNGLGGGMLESAVAVDVNTDALQRVLGTIRKLECTPGDFDGDSLPTRTGYAKKGVGAVDGGPGECVAKGLPQGRTSDSSTPRRKSWLGHYGKSPGSDWHRLDAELSGLPTVIRKAVSKAGRLKWRSVTPCLKTSRLKTGQNKYEVAFHKIAQGGKVAEHGHRGTEVTLVLKGSFSDESGVYSRGDFLVREPGQVHRPTATQNEDCLCLSVLEAPVAVTGTLGRLINPFLRFSPS